jgi:hypothetical protein
MDARPGSDLSGAILAAQRKRSASAEPREVAPTQAPKQASKLARAGGPPCQDEPFDRPSGDLRHDRDRPAQIAFMKQAGMPLTTEAPAGSR